MVYTYKYGVRNTSPKTQNRRATLVFTRGMYMTGGIYRHVIMGVLPPMFKLPLKKQGTARRHFGKILNLRKCPALPVTSCRVYLWGLWLYAIWPTKVCHRYEIAK
jgi:hypothetical protein